MASKQGKLQQRKKGAASKLLSQEHSSDPWSFLERIEAPQWVDLSLEASLIGKEGGKSWFDKSHKHHVMSLAGMNRLRLGKSSQGKGPFLFHKGAQYSNKTERRFNAHRPYGSVETGCSLSGTSSTSECEPSGSFKKRSLCSDRSSVSSSLQACSVELKKFSLNVRRGSSNVNWSEDFYDTPTSCPGGAERSRNSSSGSYCPPMVKSRYSSEVGVSTYTKVRYSSELRVSMVMKSQFVCEADRQSFGDSVVTSVSGASQTSEEQVGKGCARIWEEGTGEIRKILEDDVDYNQPLTRGFIADSSTVNKTRQQMANEVVKCGMKAGRRRLETRVSQVGSLPSNQLYAGKENAPLKENLTAANLLHVKDKPFRTKAPLAIASSRTANARTGGMSLGGGFHASQASKKEGPRCATQMVPWKSGVSQNLNSGRVSSVAHQRKRSEAKQLLVACEKTSNSERDLAALVAQHNQKIRSLGLQNCRKGLR